VRQRLAVGGAVEHFGAGGFGRRRGGELVERAEREIQIRNVFRISESRVDVHEVLGSRTVPLKFPFEPWQPTAMTGALFRFREMPPDLDHVAHDVLGERADRAGFRRLGQNHRKFDMPAQLIC
jgi:hypothetical protein